MDETEIRPPVSGEAAILAALEALTLQVQELKAMVCPVCGPAIHAGNHPEAVDVVVRPNRAERRARHNGHGG